MAQSIAVVAANGKAGQLIVKEALERGHDVTVFVRSENRTPAKQAVIKAQQYAYIGRKQKKRNFRSLWITRINAAARINGLSYSRFMNGMLKAGITLDRKVLADIAVHDAAGFAALAEKAKGALAA